MLYCTVTASGTQLLTRLLWNVCFLHASMRADQPLTACPWYQRGTSAQRLRYRHANDPQLLYEVLQLWFQHVYSCHRPAQRSDQCTGGRQRGIQSNGIAK